MNSKRTPKGQTIFQVAISRDATLRLEELASEAGMRPEQFLLASLEEWLCRPKPDISETVSYILNKNAELYRRLA